MTIRVAVVDDQALMRDGFTMILDAQDDIDVVGDAGNGRAGVELCRQTRPDVVLMDVRMPDMDGIEATRIITGDGTLATKVLVLTTFDLDEYIYAAMRAGASGFLLKDTPARDLVAAVRVIAAGDALLSPSVTKRLIEEFARRPEPEAPPAALPADLTDREREALVLLARGLSNREIAAEMYIGEATAKTHVSRLLTSSGARPGAGRRPGLRDRHRAPRGGACRRAPAGWWAVIAGRGAYGSSSRTAARVRRPMPARTGSSSEPAR